MNYILFDNQSWEDLKPLTFTRPIAELRCGILTITEKWNFVLQTHCSNKTQDYLQEKYPIVIATDNIFINATCLPNDELCQEIQSLQLGETLIKNNIIIAHRGTIESFNNNNSIAKESQSQFSQILFPWHIFSLNAQEIEVDFERITAGRTSQKISDTNRILGSENIFIEQGAIIEFATINASKGKVYIGKDAEIMEQAVIRGPFALCEHACVKMAAKIYEGTTIGPHSKVGGEIQNSVITGFSNKGHDGYLGNSVLGEWCNLGADTNNSNLKNDYSEVKVWNYTSQRFLKTGLQFCGLIMGDHSKSAINTMFNTGTVVGVSANIFGAGFPRNFIPSFSWGGPQGIEVYTVKKAIDVATRVYARRSIEFGEIDQKIFQHIFTDTEQFRRF